MDTLDKYCTTVYNKGMKKLVLGIAIVLLIAAPAAYGLSLDDPKPVQTPTVQPTYQKLDADKIFTLVNQERTSRGLSPLTRDVRLDASAQMKVEDMTAGDYFGHANPVTGKNGRSYIEDTAQGQCSFTGENLIQVGFPTADYNKKAVDGWMNSTGHRDAILRPEYNLSGVALNEGYIVQHFCISK